MNTMKTMAHAMEQAISGGVSPDLVAFVVATNHRKRLDAMFKNSASSFIEVHRLCVEHESRQAKIHRRRLKLLVDLVRVRRELLNTRRPAFEKLWADGMRRTMPFRHVETRKAA